MGTDHKINGHNDLQSYGRRRLKVEECFAHCAESDDCKSFEYTPSVLQPFCQLSTFTRDKIPGDNKHVPGGEYKESEGINYYERVYVDGFEGPWFDKVVSPNTQGTHHKVTRPWCARECRKQGNQCRSFSYKADSLRRRISYTFGARRRRGGDLFSVGERTRRRTSPPSTAACQLNMNNRYTQGAQYIDRKGWEYYELRNTCASVAWNLEYKCSQSGWIRLPSRNGHACAGPCTDAECCHKAKCGDWFGGP